MTGPQDAPPDSLERVPTQHVGPEYKSTDEKPEATVSKDLHLDNLQILPQTPQLIALLTYVTLCHSVIFAESMLWQDDTR